MLLKRPSLLCCSSLLLCNLVASFLAPLSPARCSAARYSSQYRCNAAAPNGEAADEPREHVHTVVFVRHGQSTWNKANRFIGWTDTELTEEGEIEARVAGQVLLSEGYELDVVYTSMLKRSIKTAWVVLDELGQHHVPVVTDWHLNERCYGALVGRNKKECVRIYGEEQVKLWRRSFDVRPPPISTDSKLWPGNHPKYRFLSKEQIPLHESLKDVMQRSTSYWDSVIVPAIQSGRRVCVVGHENNLRSLLKHLDGVSDADIMHVELPRAVPLVYHLDKDLKPIKLPDAAPYLSGAYVGDAEEIGAIQQRDLANVYDLTVSLNLEDSPDKRYAAKLDDILPPCEITDDDLADSEDYNEYKEDSCRGTDISNTPLYLYRSHEDKARPRVREKSQQK